MGRHGAKRHEVAQQVLALAVLAASAALIGLAFFAPLYTDEITWKYVLGHTLIDGGHFVPLGPQCPFAPPLPATFFPAALLYTIAFSQLGLLGLKISGIVLALAWLLRGYGILVRPSASRPEGLTRLASLLALQLVGVVPLTLVMARAEPLMLHCIAGYVTFPLFAPIESLTTRRQRVAALLGFLLLTSTFFFSHPKALYFTPLVIVSAFLTFWSRARPAFAAIAVAVSLLTAVQGFRVAVAMTRCDEAPLVAQALARYTLNPQLAFVDPVTFLRRGLDNLHDRTIDVAESMTLMGPLPNHWLPAVAVTPLVENANRATRFVLYAVQLGAPVLVLASLLFVRAPRVRRRIVLAATLETSLLGHVFTANHSAFYMSGLVIGVPIVVVCLAGSALRDAVADRTRLFLRPFVAASEALLQLVALFSALVTLCSLGPPLFRLSGLDGSLIPDQLGSAPIFGAARERARIREHAEQCGLHGDDSTHLVVDDVTLFAFERLHRPFMLITSSDTNMWLPDFPGAKNLELLRAAGVPGIIARCAFFPSALVGKIRRQGDYCCVGARDLELAKLPRGERVTFEAGGRGAAYVGTGWSGAEEHGRWSEGRVAELTFASSPGGAEDVTEIDLEMTAGFSEARQVQDVEVALNGETLGTVRLVPTDNDPATIRHLPITPPARLRAENLLTLRPSDPRSPKELGINEDGRTLGILLSALKLD